MTGETFTLVADRMAEEMLRWTYALVLLARPVAVLRVALVGLVVLLVLATWRLVARRRVQVPLLQSTRQLLRPSGARCDEVAAGPLGGGATLLNGSPSVAAPAGDVGG